MFHADVASDAVVRFNLWLGRGVQFQFAGNGSSSHTEIFQCSAKSGLLVSLEVGHADDDVGVGDGCTDFGSLAILSVNRNFAVVSAFQAVGNDDLALGGNRIEAVLHGAFQVVYGIGASAGVEGVAVGQERFGTIAAQQVGHACRIVGTDVGQVARLTEMYFDSHETVFQRQLGDACLLHQPFHFVE